MTDAPRIVNKIRRSLEGVTPGLWSPCHHLKSPEHDKSCGCGYRGGIWSSDGAYIVVEMGSSPDVVRGKIEGHMTPQADRPTQLADAAYIIACSPANIAALLTERDADKAALAAIIDAAEAVIQQWDTTNWKLTEHTAGFIEALRAALKEQAHGNG